MNTLYIDTRDIKNTIVRLEAENKTFERKSEANYQKAQAALPMVEKVLNEAGLKPDEIDEIRIETNGGSFTGLKVGVTIANALSFGVLVKINGKTLGEIEIPNY